MDSNNSYQLGWSIIFLIASLTAALIWIAHSTCQEEGRLQARTGRPDFSKSRYVAAVRQSRNVCRWMLGLELAIWIGALKAYGPAYWTGRGMGFHAVVLVGMVLIPLLGVIALIGCAAKSSIKLRYAQHY